MAKKMRSASYNNEAPFESPSRPNHQECYNEGMIPEPVEFGSCPSKEMNGRYEHIRRGAPVSLYDGKGGMDRYWQDNYPENDNYKEASLQGYSNSKRRK